MPVPRQIRLAERTAGLRSETPAPRRLRGLSNVQKSRRRQKRRGHFHRRLHGQPRVVFRTHFAAPRFGGGHAPAVARAELRRDHGVGQRTGVHRQGRVRRIQRHFFGVSLLRHREPVQQHGKSGYLGIPAEPVPKTAGHAGRPHLGAGTQFRLLLFLFRKLFLHAAGNAERRPARQRSDRTVLPPAVFELHHSRRHGAQRP